MTRILLTAAVAMLAMTIAQRPAQAHGEKPWCAVINGGGDIHMECEYNSVQECAPNVVAGNRGSCAPNPYYTGPAPRRAAPRHRGRQY